MTKINTQEYYDEISPGYDELHSEEQKKKLTLIKENTPTPKKILDIGSGTGISTEFFENITCIEPSIKMIKEGQKKRKYTAICDYAENLNKHYKENEFDTIICVSTIHHVKNPEQIFKTIQKICKPHGEIIITFLKRSNKTQKLIKLAKKKFPLKKEITEEKDIILFFKNQKKRTFN